MTEKLNAAYWENRYVTGNTAWDAGEITAPLKKYFDGLKSKNLKILIPGAGNGHEAIYLHNHAFADVTVVDLAQLPLNNILKNAPTFPVAKLLKCDFFEHPGSYDLIVEQTFFCALPVDKRSDYAKKMSELLTAGGKLAGVLFDAEFDGGLPFGGNKSEYLQYFTPYFQINTFDRCYNSIKPRENRELFMVLQKK